MLTVNRIQPYLVLILGMIMLFAEDDLRASNTDINTQIEVSKDSPLRSFMFMRELDERRFSEDSLDSYKELALLAARQDDVPFSAEQAKKYVTYSGETGFVESGYFKRFKDTPEFEKLRGEYIMKFRALDVFYLFSALIGFFIGTVLLLRKKKDLTATLLISTFVLVHSIFIFHLFLYTTNLQFRVPHTVFMSAIFSYLYGPLIYFYFRRVVFNYKFKKRDILHLIPTLAFILLLLPVFTLPSEEKLRIMLHVGKVDILPYLNLLSSTKTASLLIYGFLLARSYYRSRDIRLKFSKDAQRWMRDLVFLTVTYVVTYLFYGLVITKTIPKSEILFNLPIVAMALMVLYIGYKSYLRPNLFTVQFKNVKTKYNKSGLTPSFSLELKEELMFLLKKDKIYRENNISLAKVAERLGTTRHNASQVINEHFGLNFFELINKYRIDEALEILKNDTEKNLNIIDVAYEVGFNNKVTFNKSFRKQLSLTPTQYLNNLKAS